MGRPAPEYAVAVVDDGRPAGAVRASPASCSCGANAGVSLFAEYLGDPEATAGRSPTTAGSAPATGCGGRSPAR